MTNSWNLTDYLEQNTFCTYSHHKYLPMHYCSFRREKRWSKCFEIFGLFNRICSWYVKFKVIKNDDIAALSISLSQVWHTTLPEHNFSRSPRYLWQLEQNKWTLIVSSANGKCLNKLYFELGKTSFAVQLIYHIYSQVSQPKSNSVFYL